MLRLIRTLLTSPRFLATQKSTPNAPRLPTVFVSHGGGPLFFMDTKGGAMAAMDMTSEAKRSVEKLPKQLGVEKPSAIVVVSVFIEIIHGFLQKKYVR